MSIADNLCAYHRALLAGGLPSTLVDEIVLSAAKYVHQGEIDSSDLAGRQGSTVIYNVSTPKLDPAVVNQFVGKYPTTAAGAI